MVIMLLVEPEVLHHLDLIYLVAVVEGQPVELMV